MLEELYQLSHLAINLSILDFKPVLENLRSNDTMPINLSILDFKQRLSLVLESRQEIYKSIHIGF